MIGCGLGPIILALIYQILKLNNVLETLTVDQVCLGILSLSVLAFFAGGLNSLYQIERLPLMLAILIHGSVLYAVYLITYLINGWLEWGMIQVLIFSGIFVIGYIVIWIIIYSITRKNTDKINEILKEKQETIVK